MEKVTTPNEATSNISASATSASKKNKQNTHKGMLIGMIIFAILATGGIAFGVYGMISQNKKVASLENDLANCANASNNEIENITVTCPDGTSTEIVKNVITNDLAQSLINPYLGTFNYLHNILDYTFDDAAKMVVAFRNMNPESIYSYQSDNIGIYYRVDYSDINSQYQKMFGNSSSIEKKDYNPGHSLTFSYINDGGHEMFEVMPFNGGGTGMAMFSVVKNASYNDENIIVNVYHDNVPVCEAVDSTNKYCIEVNGSAIINSIDDFNMRELINSFADKIPVYTMTFTKNNSHYVLSNIQKQ